MNDLGDVQVEQERSRGKELMIASKKRSSSLDNHTVRWMNKPRFG